MRSEEDEFMSTGYESTDDSQKRDAGPKAVRLGKRKSRVGETSGESPKLRRAAIGNATEEEERRGVERKVHAQEEKERKERKEKEERAMIDRRAEGNGDREEREVALEEGIEKMQGHLKKIMEAVGREEKGKISFTRGDQIVVKDAVYFIRSKMLEIREGAGNISSIVLA